MITRRNLIKSLAILGAGISVPLMAHDGQALYSTTHPEVCGPPRPVQPFSEGALEDSMVGKDRRKYLSVFGDRSVHYTIAGSERMTKELGYVHVPTLDMDFTEITKSVIATRNDPHAKKYQSLISYDWDPGNIVQWHAYA